LVLFRWGLGGKRLGGFVFHVLMHLVVLLDV